jgi:hydrogenase-4 component F
MLAIYFILSLVLIGSTFLFKQKTTWWIIMLIFLAVQSALPVYGYLNLNNEDLGYFRYDALGIIFLAVLSILSISTVFHSYKYLGHRSEPPRMQRFYIAALIALIASMTGVYLSDHIGVMWFFVEATTLSVSFLIYHERTPIALEATWKYIFICSIGIALAFVGIIFLGTALEEGGSADLSFRSMPNFLGGSRIFMLKFSFIFMLIGFSTKMGLFPMHPIAVDAHTVAPPPISAFISTTLMNVGFVAIFRSYALFAHTPIHHWMNNILLISGLLSIFVSAIYLVRVKHLKRMSAYSSLEHMGLAAIGLATGGIGYFASILHLVLHSFAKASIFYQVDQIHRVFKSYFVKDTRGYFNRNLAGAIVMILAFIAITALPPSGMFVTEFWLMQSLFQTRNFIVLILALLFLTVAMFGLGKNIFTLLFAPPESPALSDQQKVPFYESISQFILIGLVFYLGLNPPSGMINLINEAVKYLP